MFYTGIMEAELLKTVIPSLGFSAVFLYLLNKLWEYHKEKMKVKDASIATKDEQIKEMTDKVLVAFNQNTKVVEQMKATIRENTEVSKNLSDVVVSTLKKG